MQSKDAKEFISVGPSNHQSKKTSVQRIKMLKIQLHTELEDSLFLAASRTGPRPALGFENHQLAKIIGNQFLALMTYR